VSVSPVVSGPTSPRAPSQAAILVTGAAGFAGSHLLDLLRHDERPIVGWHHPGAPPPRTNSNVAAEVDAVAPLTWQPVDLLDPMSVREAIAALRPAAVYHLAGAAQQGKSWDHADDVLRVNVMGTQHLLDALARAGVHARTLVIGSATVYRPSDRPLDEEAPIGPTSPYGISKLAQELVAQQAFAHQQIPVIVARSFNHIGPRQGLGFVAADFARQIAGIERGRAAPVISVGNLDARRDLMDVRDTARAYHALMRAGTPGRAYNVCAGRAYGMRELLDGLLRHSSVRVDVRIDPDKLRPIDQPVVLGSFDRLSHETGWHPEIPMDRTLADLLDYWRVQQQSA
jgi:GDP-4-dehydro-6-deoxy-D-mannose reductase